jgi:hypothetical protein
VPLSPSIKPRTIKSIRRIIATALHLHRQSGIERIPQFHQSTGTTTPPTDHAGKSRLTSVFVLTGNKDDGVVPEGFKAANLRVVFDEFKEQLTIARLSIAGRNVGCLGKLQEFKD